MQTQKAEREKVNAQSSRFNKRIGSTVYHVNVHFNPNTKETAGDKLALLIRNDAATGKAVNQ